MQIGTVTHEPLWRQMHNNVRRLAIFELILLLMAIWLVIWYEEDLDDRKWSNDFLKYICYKSVNSFYHQVYSKLNIKYMIASKKAKITLKC